MPRPILISTLPGSNRIVGNMREPIYKKTRGLAEEQYLSALLASVLKILGKLNTVDD